MTNLVTVTGRLSLNVPAESALAVIWDVENIGLYEPKVSAMLVTPETKKKGTYYARGRFAGIPWGGKFSYELNNKGFHSEMLRGSGGIRVSGGFIVKSERPDKCLVTHYERYRFPRLLSPLVPAVRIYLFRAMKKELTELAKICCAEFRRGAEPERSSPG